MTNAPPEITRELSRTEKLLWAGQPRQGKVLRGSDVFALPLSLVAGVFAIRWVFTAPQSAGGDFWIFLLGLPFLAFSFYFIVGRFFLEADRYKKTFYAVTEERILIVSTQLSPTVRSLDLRTLNGLSLLETAGGDGFIYFGGASQVILYPLAGGAYVGPHFARLTNAKSVYEIIREAQRASTAHSNTTTSPARDLQKTAG